MKTTTTKTTASNLFPFRVVVRGTLGDKRVRRVQTVHATDEGAAAAQADEAKLCKGLKDPYINVFPPIMAA